MQNAIQIESNVHLERLLTTDPTMEQYIRTAIGYVMEKARKDVVSKAASVMQSDPKKAASAIRRTIYKQVLGANLNILRKKRAGRKGNVPSSTRGRSADTERYLGYQGSDRGFILRFINAGTDDRVATHMNDHPIKRSGMVKSHIYRSGQIGGRGSILGHDFFGPAAKAAIEEATELLTKEFEKIVAEQTK